MAYDSERHHRRSVRLRGYDYSRTGVYFVTICVQGRDCLFGEIRDAQMVCNDAGRMIQTVWDELPTHYPGVDVNDFVMMPNHIHGLIVLTAPEVDSPRLEPALALGDVVHRFKTLTTKRYTDGVKQSGWTSFMGRLWQRNYYEHIVRHDKELDAIREYILKNPANWNEDREHPDATM